MAKLSERLATINAYDGADAIAEAVALAKEHEAASGWRTIGEYQDGDVVDVWLQFDDGHGERWCDAYRRDGAWMDSLTGDYLAMSYDAFFTVTHFMAPPSPPESES